MKPFLTEMEATRWLAQEFDRNPVEATVTVLVGEWQRQPRSEIVPPWWFRLFRLTVRMRKLEV